MKILKRLLAMDSIDQRVTLPWLNCAIKVALRSCHFMTDNLRNALVFGIFAFKVKHECHKFAIDLCFRLWNGGILWVKKSSKKRANFRSLHLLLPLSRTLKASNYLPIDPIYAPFASTHSNLNSHT